MKNTRDWHVYMRALRLREASAEPYLCRHANVPPYCSDSSVSAKARFGKPVPAIRAGGTPARIQHCSTLYSTLHLPVTSSAPAKAIDACNIGDNSTWRPT